MEDEKQIRVSEELVIADRSSRYDTFERLMAEVDAGLLSLVEAVDAYRKIELGDVAMSASV